MRKRLVIGAIAAVVIGVAAYVLSQPRKGSVEWHRRGYLSAVEQLFAESLVERFTHVIEKLVGVPPSVDAQAETFHQHMRFLVTTGFLASTEFRIANGDLTEVARKAFAEAKVRIPPERGRYWYFIGKENSLWVVCLPEDVSVWKELIKKWDK